MPESRSVVFKDFDISFTRHPVTRKLSILKNDLAVARSIKNLVLTNKFERPYQPTLGSHVRARLFENADSFTGELIQQDITECIESYEPRAQLLEVRVSASPNSFNSTHSFAEDIDNNGFNVTIIFRTINQSKPIQISFLIERVR
jgi:phage baseplate assembly protein W